MRAVLLALALIALLPLRAEACGMPDRFCEVPLGKYRLAMPESEGGLVPAVVFLHGWGGSSEGVVRRATMLRELSARGYALIAPEGEPRPGRKQRNWSVRDTSTYERDDIAFLNQVLDDAARRGVDRRRILLTGFSRGGSMVWDVACLAPHTARAYAPVAGAFWEPLPKTCKGPVDLFHTHGWADRVVPIEGRSVANGRLTQGDTFASLAVMRGAVGCHGRMPDRTERKEDDVWLRHWTTCEGGRLDLWLHPGQHSVPYGWVTRALDWFEARLAEDID